MAKVTDQVFYHKNDAGEAFRYVAPINVDSSGTFRVALPKGEELDVFRQIAKKVKEGDRQGWVLIKMEEAHRGGNSVVVSSSNLDLIKSFIVKVLKVYLTCKTTTELVICYRTQIALTAAKDDQGALGPDGYHVPGTFLGTWFGKFDGGGQSSVFDHHREFSVGLFARVLYKTTHTRLDNTRIVYSRPDTEDLGPAAEYLNAFHNRGGLDDREGKWDTPVKELPYSEEAAAFFGQTLLALCTLGQRMESFFASPEALTSAISQQATLGMKPGGPDAV